MGNFIRRKTGQGIYRKDKTGLFVWDIKAQDYRPIHIKVSRQVKKIYQQTDLAKIMQQLKASQDPHAQLLWRLHLDMWHYAACAAEEITCAAEYSARAA